MSFNDTQDGLWYCCPELQSLLVTSNIVPSLPIVLERNGHVSSRTGNFIKNVAQVGACRKGHDAAYFRKYWEMIIANVLMQEKASFALRKARIMRDVHTGKVQFVEDIGKDIGLYWSEAVEGDLSYNMKGRA